MAATLSGRLSEHFAPLHDHPTADDALLTRYAESGDDAAFALLVKRHGGMVTAVCRKRLNHAHDAEDAAQAVFLALARKAGRVAGSAPVAAWLYGATVQACREVARRNRRKPWLPLAEEPPGDAPLSPDFEAVSAVLDEVAGLPEDLRAAVVLCELEGVPRALAARRLGVAEGTLSSRLASARKRLASSLDRRGFGPAALALVAGLASGVPAPAVPLSPALLLAPGLHRLTEGVMTTTLAWKAKLAATLSVATLSITLAVAAGDGPTPQAPEPARSTPVTPAAAGPRFTLVTQSADKAGGVQEVTATEVTADGVVAATRTQSFTPTAEKLIALSAKPGRSGIDNVKPVVFDVAGRAAAFSHTYRSRSTVKQVLMPLGKPTQWLDETYRSAYQTPAGKVVPLAHRDDHEPAYFWSHDGKMLFQVCVGTTGSLSVSLGGPPVSIEKQTTYVVGRIDVATGEARNVFFGIGDMPLAVAPDGKTFLVQSVRGESFFGGSPEYRLGLMQCRESREAVQNPAKPLSEWGRQAYHEAAFSPNGKMLAVGSVNYESYPIELLPPEHRPSRPELKPLWPSRFISVVDVENGFIVSDEKMARVKSIHRDGSAPQAVTAVLAAAKPKCVPNFGRGLQWSPDGTRVAFTDADGWTKDHSGDLTARGACVVELSTDGTTRCVPLPQPGPLPFGYADFGPALVGWR